MAERELPQSSIILYQTEDGRTRIECRFDEETLWLTQAQVAELFQTTPQNVTPHLMAIFAEGELTEAASCKDYLQVCQEGVRAVMSGFHCNIARMSSTSQTLKASPAAIAGVVGTPAAFCERLVRPAIIVVHEVKRDRVKVILGLF